MHITSDPSYSDVVSLLSEATTYLIMRAHVPVTHASDWKRPEGWPLPTVKVHGTGLITQEYRAMALIEWCDFKLDEPRRMAQGARAAAARSGA